MRRSGRVHAAAVPLCLVASICAPGTALGAGWAVPAQQVSPAGSTVFGVRAAVAPTAKDATVAYVASGSTIEVLTRPAGGAFATTVVPTAAAANSVGAVAAALDGTTVVTWQQGSDLRAVERPAGGAPETTSRLLAQSINGHTAAAATDGTVMVLYSNLSGYSVRIRPPGGPFGQAIPFFTLPAGEVISAIPVIAAVPGGDLVAFITTAKDTGTPPNTSRTITTRAIRRSAVGVMSAPETVLTATATSDGAFMRLRSLDALMPVVTSGGDILLGLRDTTDERLRSDVSDMKVTTRSLVVRRAAATGTWGGAQELGTGTQESSPGPLAGTAVSGPVLAVGSDDRPTAAWAASTPTATTVRAATAGSPLGAFENATDVATGGTGLADTVSYPALVAQRGGGMLLVLRRGSVDVARIRPDATSPFGAETAITPAGQSLSARLISGTPDGDALVAWTHYDAPASKYRAWTAVYDASGPVIREVSIPASGTPATPVAFHAAAVDAFSTSSLSWLFGDGSGAAAGGDVTHAFPAGTYGPAVTATDGVGNTTTASGPLTVAAPAATPTPTPTPGPGGGPGTGTGGQAIRDFRITPTRFAVATGVTPLSAGAARGARILFRTALPGSARIAFHRLLPGRRSGKRCVPKAKAPRGAKACTRAVLRATLTRRTTGAAQATRLTGRLGKVRLAPGRYRASMTARAAGSSTSTAARTRAFTIVRR